MCFLSKIGTLFFALALTFAFGSSTEAQSKAKSASAKGIPTRLPAKKAVVDRSVTNAPATRSTAAQTVSTSRAGLLSTSSQHPAAGAAFGLAFSSMSDLETKVSANGNSGDLTMKGSAAANISARYGFEISHGFAVLPGLAYEADRNFDRSELKSNGETTTRDTEGNPRLASMVVEPSLAFAPHSKLFVFAGPNYTLPIKNGNWDNAEINGAFGFQGGVAVKPIPQLGIEAMYRTLNYEVKAPGLSFDYARIWGFVMRATYTL